ncbi:MAG: hypothetical protein H6632_13385 [Anaerolineales bacterium]|nr:hypothetical protein [Anaerolineales bacterium]
MTIISRPTPSVPYSRVLYQKLTKLSEPAAFWRRIVGRRRGRPAGVGRA